MLERNVPPHTKSEVAMVERGPCGAPPQDLIAVDDRVGRDLGFGIVRVAEGHRARPYGTIGASGPVAPVRRDRDHGGGRQSPLRLVSTLSAPRDRRPAAARGGTMEIWDCIDAERTERADLLDTLTPEQWDMPSLCTAWRVRDVAAHMNEAATLSTGAGMVLAARYGFRIGTMLEREAIKGGARRP